MKTLKQPQLAESKAFRQSFQKDQSFFTKEIASQKVIEEKLSKIKKIFSRKIEQVLDSQVNFNYSGTIVRASPLDIARIVSEISLDSELEYSIRNILLNAVLSCDKRACGSGILALDLICNNKQYCAPNDIFYRIDDEKIIDSFLNTYCRNGISKKIIKSIFEYSGPGVAIQFTNTLDKNYQLISYEGKNIRGNIDQVFKSKLNTVSGVKCIFTKGIIESIGEIDNLLEQISYSKDTVIIFAKGFSPDVSNTLYKNFKNKKLKVIPYVYSEEEESIEKFCFENNINIITPQLGSRYNLVNVEDLRVHKKISLSNGFCTISDTGTDSSHVEIKIPLSKKNIEGLIKDRIIFGKLALESLLRTGFQYYSIGNNNKNIVVSNSSIDFAIKSCESFNTSMKNLGLILIN